jgi:hypothetical protein
MMLEQDLLRSYSNSKPLLVTNLNASGASLSNLQREVEAVLQSNRNETKKLLYK